MTEPSTDRQAANESTPSAADRMKYPENHVVGIVDTTEQFTAVKTALTSGGFLASEVNFSAGSDAAAALDASTGRGGLAGLAMRIADKVGIENDEMAVKEHFETALRDGKLVVRILALTDERKMIAAQVLGENGGHAIWYLGRSSMERIRR